MTAPRQILPDTTYLVTRRCAQRQFLLRPSKVTSQVFLYLLALGARRYGIEVHAYCVMSNHYHLVVTDLDAQLPAFLQYLDGLAGRAINALLGHGEAFWGPDSYSAVTLASPRDVVDKTAYTLANPVAAGLVRSGRRWPGLWSNPEDVGAGERLVPRPSHFFDPGGGLPESFPFQLTTPPGFASAVEFREQVMAALAEREAEAARRVAGFLGVARVLAQRATARPRKAEPRRQLNPRVASRDRWRRIEALGRLVCFLAEYRAALREWHEGKKSVLFPAGTYEMRVSYGVACAGAG
jgi:REP element-mobilizing transposase RayT